MHRHVIAMILCLTSLHCSKNQAEKMPEPAQSSAHIQTPTFDSQKAFAYLTAQTDFGPRVTGTPAHQRCLQYLQNELQKTADAVTLQPFTHIGYNGETLNMTNIFASFNAQAKQRILLIAHWDSRPQADQDPDPKKRDLPILGANDGASGVAILLEIARHLKEIPPSVGVDMLFVDGEDYGKEGDTENYLLGARYFTQNLPPGFNPMFGILLDMVGDKDLEIPKEPNSIQYAPDIVNLVWETAKDLGVFQFTDRTQRPVIDDHLPFNEAGIKTIDLIDFDYPPWHTTEDTPDKCSPESLQAVGKVLLHVIFQSQK